MIHLADRKCRACGEPIPAHRHANAWYCGGGRCSNMATPATPTEGECAVCKGPMLLQPAGHGRPRLYCSNECTRAAHQKREFRPENVSALELAVETVAAGGEVCLAVRQYRYHGGNQLGELASSLGIPVLNLIEIEEKQPR